MNHLTLSEAKQIITECSPDFAMHSFRSLGQGTDNIAYIANDTWIFRFPSTSLSAQQNIEREIKLLITLSDFLPAKIPRFKYVVKSEQVIYVAYPLLEGMPLTASNFEKMSVAVQTKTLRNLISFIERLHQFPVVIANECGVRADLYKGAYHPEQKFLFASYKHLLTQQEINKIESIFTNYENKKSNSYIPVLLHADLKPEHILCDLYTGDITGIIDWGDVTIGDPDNDFTCFSIFYEKNFFNQLMALLPIQERQRIEEKLPFFILIRWLQDIALFYQSEDEKMVQYCLKKLRQHLFQL